MYTLLIFDRKAKEKYRGVFEIQKSGDKTSSGEIGLDIRTHASPKVGQDQVSGGVSVLCWHAAPVVDHYIVNYHTCLTFNRYFSMSREKEEIWLSPMTEALTPTEKSKKQRDNTKNATKNFDYTTIADRLRTVSWGNDSHPAGVVKPVYGIPTFPLTAKAV